MQTPVCPLCISQNNEERFSERGYRLLFCHVCGLFFISPYPTDKKQVHNRVSDYSFDEIEILDPENHYLAEVQYYEKYYPFIAHECEGAGSLLDVGCGTGHLLEQLSAVDDLYLTGIELNADRAEMARKKSGCEIHQVPIEEFKSATKFDVVTMINVLSHIPSFDSLFNSIRSLMSENGRLVLKVGELKKDVRKGDLFDWGIPDHLHFLGLGTINYICSKYGFKINTHDRIPLSQELFSPHTWRSPGRSSFRNAIKRMVVHTPFALAALARYYDITHGTRIYSSFISLSPQS